MAYIIPVITDLLIIIIISWWSSIAPSAARGPPEYMYKLSRLARSIFWLRISSYCMMNKQRKSLLELSLTPETSASYLHSNPEAEGAFFWCHHNHHNHSHLRTSRAFHLFLLCSRQFLGDGNLVRLWNGYQVVRRWASRSSEVITLQRDDGHGAVREPK